MLFVKFFVRFKVENFKNLLAETVNDVYSVQKSTTVFEPQNSAWPVGMPECMTDNAAAGLQQNSNCATCCKELCRFAGVETCHQPNRERVLRSFSLVSGKNTLLLSVSLKSDLSAPDTKSKNALPEEQTVVFQHLAHKKRQADTEEQFKLE